VIAKQSSLMKQPHFDDRRVLQRAQQVVPLTRIRARRLFFLSGAFAVAMMLGAASALLAVHIKQRGQVTRINTDLPSQTTRSETVAAAPVESPANVPEVEETEETEETGPPVIQVAAPKRQQPAITHRPRVVATRPDEVQPTEEEQLEQIRESVLYDQWQERRMRRAARRERRNRGDRDLSHVDEIFEGPRRRDRP
jgi:hypothetical protein